MNLSVILVAGGEGTRFGSVLPKQFQLLSGKPVLFHSLLTFSEAFPGINIVVVLPENYIDLWKKLCFEHYIELPHQVVAGGPERFHSVKSGLAVIDNDCIVAIHDAARPLVSKALVRRVFIQARVHPAVVPAIIPHDSVRMVDKALNKPVSRDLLRLIQTPQVFHSEILKKAYQQNYRLEFTDDATVVESVGMKITLIEGDPENIKITTPTDLIIAQAILNHRTT